MKTRRIIVAFLILAAAYAGIQSLIHRRDWAVRESGTVELQRHPYEVHRHPYLNLAATNALVVAENHFVNVGKVAIQEVLEASFRIENHSDHMVRILPYFAPCPGAYVDRDEQSIAPGEAGEVVVQFRFRALSPNKDALMPFTIATDDAATPWIRLAVVGRPL